MKAQCTLRAKGSFPAISSGHTHKQEQVFEAIRQKISWLLSQRVFVCRVNWTLYARPDCSNVHKYNVNISASICREVPDIWKLWNLEIAEQREIGKKRSAKDATAAKTWFWPRLPLHCGSAHPARTPRPRHRPPTSPPDWGLWEPCLDQVCWFSLVSLCSWDWMWKLWPGSSGLVVCLFKRSDMKMLIRDNVYSISAAWALALAYRRQPEKDGQVFLIIQWST